MMDTDTIDMLRTSLRHVLTQDSTQSLGQRLDELGWDEVVADDASTALRTLFEIKGDTVSSADALGPRLAAALAAAAGDADLATVVVALPSPFGESVDDAGAGQLVVEALTLSAPPAGFTIVVPVGSNPRLALVTISPTTSLAAAPLTGVDDQFGLHRVTGTVSGRDVRWLDDHTAPDLWSAVVTHGRWLVSCELVGIARHVIASAAQYTGERVQYGRPIGTFQALQHRIASAYALVVGAAHVAEEAGNAGDEWSALVAKAVAGQAAEFACTQAQQCYGAIGFTWEHEFHHYLRRTYVLDRLFGDWRTLETEIGTRLLSTGVVPHIGAL